MDNYKNKLGDLANKLMKERPATPVQQVLPVKTRTPVKAPEVQFNNWIPKTLLKRVKAYGVEHDLSLKAINIFALEAYLDRKEKQEQTNKKAT